MKIKISTLFIIIFCSSILYGQENKGQKLNCANFKTGRFETYADTMRIVLERKDGYQYEKVGLGISKYKMTWTSECEYVLELVESNMKYAQKLIGNKYYVKITDTTPTEYSYECTTLNPKYTDKGKIKKIE